jgi:hypothetical protein
MALVLAFTAVEQGDAKLLTISDSTGTGATGWSTGGNPAITDITALHLDIDITTSAGTTISYDRISLTGSFTLASQLVFSISCADLKVSAVALGTASDVLPDGLYAITYTYNSTATHTDSTVLIDGNVKAAVYELLRTISTKYECEDNHERDILDIIFIKGYYDGMIATAIVGREDQVIDQLFVLERLVTNGSSYTW